MPVPPPKQRRNAALPFQDLGGTTTRGADYDAVAREHPDRIVLELWRFKQRCEKEQARLREEMQHLKRELSGKLSQVLVTESRRVTDVPILEQACVVQGPTGESGSLQPPVCEPVLHSLSDASFLTESEWSFQESIWDVAAFVGSLQGSAKIESMTLVFLLVVCVTAQFCFVMIVWLNLSDSEADHQVIEGYRIWRATTGHSYQFMDALTFRSLASRVCEGDSSLHLSNTQSDQIQNIDAYLYDNYPFNGPLMCCLALLAWTLAVSKEFRMLSDQIRALTRLPHAEVTTLSLDKGKLVLQSLSYSRKTYILLLCLCRTLLAVTLSVAGLRFLVVTISIEEMLLNAVALEFVLSVDEMLFHALVPGKSRSLISSLRPLPTYKHSKAWHGLDCHFLLNAMLIFGTLTVVVFWWLLPEIQNVKDAKDALCGGDMNFIFTPTRAHFVVWSKDPRISQMNEYAEKFKNSYTYRLLTDVIRSKFSPHTHLHEVPRVSGSTFSVANLNMLDIASLSTEINAGCVDVLNGTQAPKLANVRMQTWALASLRDELEGLPVRYCSDIQQHCNSYFKPVVRMWCPETCGCHIFNSPLTLPQPADGCSGTCAQTLSYTSTQQAVPCNDVPNLTSSTVFLTYVGNVRLSVDAWPLVHQAQISNVTALMLQHGCAAIPTLQAIGLNFCIDWYHIKSLAVWCPTTCSCKLRRSSSCPASCYKEI